VERFLSGHGDHTSWRRIKSTSERQFCIRRDSPSGYPKHGDKETQTTTSPIEIHGFLFAKPFVMQMFHGKHISALLEKHCIITTLTFFVRESCITNLFINKYMKFFCPAVFLRWLFAGSVLCIIFFVKNCILQLQMHILQKMFLHIITKSCEFFPFLALKKKVAEKLPATF
jgi:hypothetical protein